MNNFDIYNDIAKRTDGDIYIGVVGPVRTGKSTFVSRFMETLVLPNLKNQNLKQRAIDELPQSADGKTIMTTQPKFVPEESVRVKFGDQTDVSIRLVDCVGYMVDGALGGEEDEKPRLVKTPWSAEAIPFEKAAEIGTKKVVGDHSTVAVVVTNDGTITDIQRGAYLPAEERVVNELKQLEKPFVILLNSKTPHAEETQKLKNSLCEKYGVSVLAIDIKNMDANSASEVMQCLLTEFPIERIKINIPKWMRTLDSSSSIIGEIITEVCEKTKSVKKMKDVDCLDDMFLDSQNLYPCKAIIKNMGQGVVECEVEPRPELFFRTLSETAQNQIDDEYSLMHYVQSLSHAKKQFDKIEQALSDVDKDGYGIVMPDEKEMVLETPEIFKQGAQYGVKLKASASTLHIMRVDVNTIVSPVVGTQQQSEYILSSFESDPKAIWDTNMFGKSMSQLVKESLCAKSSNMPIEVQAKIRKTVGRVVNENKGGLLCILL